MIVGVTGGIGAGKSLVARFWATKGAIVIDADEVAREVISPTGLVWEKLVDHFGQEILSKDKTIDRKKLGRIVFFDSRELRALNRLTHPAIKKAIEKRLKRLKKAVSPNQVVVIDAPLLAEAGLLSQVDVVVVVAASEKIRLERLKKLGLSTKEAKARIKAQTPEAKRFQLADYIIKNEEGLKALQKKAEELWGKKIKKRSRKSE